MDKLRIKLPIKLLGTTSEDLNNNIELPSESKMDNSRDYIRNNLSCSYSLNKHKNSPYPTPLLAIRTLMKDREL